MKKRKSTLFNLKPSKPFIESCTEMCWFMTMQQPPMVFYFGGHKKNTQLERDYFQFYTKSGSLLDFVVWPALKLHENGPLLRKGVAEPLAEMKR